MAATNGHNEDQYPKELRLSLHRLNILPNYANIPLCDRFNSFGGVGLQALRDIPFGTPIFSEPELFSKAEGREVTQTQARIRGFQELICPFDSDTADARFYANSFTIGKDRQGRRLDGIFLKSSRFNQSCVPNAYFTWNSNSQRLTVHAIVNIREGEEIFVNYYAEDYGKTRGERQEALSATYNFVCTCRACDQRPAFGLKSEERRRQIHDLHEYIKNNRNSNQTHVREQLLANIQASITLLNKVGLIYPQLADMYSEAVWWYQVEVDRATRAEHSRYKVACLEKALQFARDQLCLDVACNGHDSPVVEETLKTIADLKQMNISGHSYRLRSSHR